MNKSNKITKKPLRGISEIKTPLKMKMQNRPKAKNAEYLNLYLINKEKERNLQELTAISKRHNQLKDNIKVLDDYTDNLLGEITSGERASGEITAGNTATAEPPTGISPESSPARGAPAWKTLKIEY